MFKRINPIYLWLFGGLFAQLSRFVDEQNEILRTAIILVGCLIALLGIILYFKKRD